MQCILELNKQVKEQHVKNDPIYSKSEILLSIYSKLKDISFYVDSSNFSLFRYKKIFLFGGNSRGE